MTGTSRSRGVPELGPQRVRLVRPDASTPCAASADSAVPRTLTSAAIGRTGPSPSVPGCKCSCSWVQKTANAANLVARQPDDAPPVRRRRPRRGARRRRAGARSCRSRRTTRSRPASGASPFPSASTDRRTSNACPSSAQIPSAAAHGAGSYRRIATTIVHGWSLRLFQRWRVPFCTTQSPGLQQHLGTVVELEVHLARHHEVEVDGVGGVHPGVRRAPGRSAIPGKSFARTRRARRRRRGLAGGRGVRRSER